MLLTKDAILSADDLARAEVDVEAEWGGTVLVRELTGTERDDYEYSLMQVYSRGKQTSIKPNFANAKARLAVKAIINEDGSRVFTDADAKILGDKSASALNKIVDEIQRLSGMTQKDLEELEKNSVAGPSDGSISV